MEGELDDIIGLMKSGFSLSGAAEGSGEEEMPRPKPRVELDDNSAFEIHVYQEIHSQLSSEIQDIKNQIRTLRTKIKDKLVDLEEHHIELAQKELDIKLVWAKAGNDQDALDRLRLDELDISNRRENLNERIFADSKKRYIVERKRRRVDTLYCPDDSDHEYWTSE